MSEFNNDRLLDFSDDFVFSCGTVPVDVSRGLVLLLYYRPKQEYMLPKGRKDLGESFEDSAVRETLEESGYQCSLLEHNLPTKATGSTQTAHREPIAVQQRFHQGTRKIILWYLAKVNAYGSRLPQTEEDQKDFEVRWANLHDAPSMMSFEDDRKIVKKAISAMSSPYPSCHVANPDLQKSFLSPLIDVRGLGFLCISLGGSLPFTHPDVVGPQGEDQNADWDGFGVVESKLDIIRLIKEDRRKLRALLWIDKEECPDRAFEDLEPTDAWDVVRYSGWTSQGSKRSLKIWSKQGLDRVFSEPEPSYLGVLSYKFVPIIRCKHPIYGPQLFVHQPTRSTSSLHILHDSDLLIPQPNVADAAGSDSQPMTFGVTCDLFLTSMCVFEHAPGAMATFKAAILGKWQRLTKSIEVQTVASLFYRGASLAPRYAQMLGKEIKEIQSKITNDANEFHKLDLKHHHRRPESIIEDTTARSPLDQTSKYPARYKAFHVQPLTGQGLAACTPNAPPLLAEGRDAVCLGIDTDSIVLVPTPFSSNSAGSYANIRTSAHSDWTQAFVKEVQSIHNELAAVPAVKHYFPKENVQNTLAAGPGQRLYFDYFDGDTLNNVRLHHHQDHLVIHERGEEYSTDEWFVSIEVRRARDILAAYSASLSPAATDTCAQQSIHAFYHDRLTYDRRLQDFYGGNDMSFPPSTAYGKLSLDAILAMPIIINGQSQRNLRHHLDQAQVILDPNNPSGLGLLPTAFGFGDGHGGNVMVSKNSAPEQIRYIDYEATGKHTPFLDMAKPIFLDGFFEVAYADLLYDDLTTTDKAEAVRAEWKIESNTIYIDYDIHLNALSKALAVIKLEYTLRPMLDALDSLSPHLRNLAEDTLAYGLFSCALLSRDYSPRPDVFFLNLAVGVQIATNVRKTFWDVFGWYNWDQRVPRTSPAPDAYITITSQGTRVSQDDLLGPDLNIVAHSNAQIDTTTNVLLRLDTANAFLGMLSKVARSLEPEVVFLKRHMDTLGLHRIFSSTPNESDTAVIRRIDGVRKEAMKIAPYMCIRECLFAESRIDGHFAYQNVLCEAAQDSSKKLIDVGCCMATDIRTLIAHGFPVKNITGLDTQQGFINLGFLLYNQDKSIFGVHFRVADVLDPHFYKSHQDLEGAFDFVHTANMLQLYDSAQQEDILRTLAFLVKPRGMIWGRQVGLDDEEANFYRQPEGKGARFTAREFHELWLAATGWHVAEAHFEAVLAPYEELRDQRVDKRWSMQWSIRAPAAQYAGRVNEVKE